MEKAYGETGFLGNKDEEGGCSALENIFVSCTVSRKFWDPYSLNKSHDVLGEKAKFSMSHSLNFTGHPISDLIWSSLTKPLIVRQDYSVSIISPGEETLDQTGKNEALFSTLPLPSHGLALGGIKAYIMHGKTAQGLEWSLCPLLLWEVELARNLCPTSLGTFWY